MNLKIFTGFLFITSLGFAQVPPPFLEAFPTGLHQRRNRPRSPTSASVASGEASATPLELSLRAAIQRGLRYNLGILTNRDITDTLKADRRRALSALLPNLSVGATQTSQQLDLVAFGFHVPGFPAVVGPFGYQNIRAYLQQTVYDRSSQKNFKSANESQKAAELNAEDGRNLVVQAVSNAYLSVITDMSRVDAIQAELNTTRRRLYHAPRSSRSETRGRGGGY